MKKTNLFLCLNRLLRQAVILRWIVILLVLTVAFTFIFGLSSCGPKSTGSKGVISLLDSLGVGDVPSYPGSKYDKELNEQLGEFKDQLTEIPREFNDVLYSVYVTRDDAEKVIDFYNLELSELDWKKINDIRSDNGSMMVWEKTANRGGNVTYIIITGNIKHGDRETVVILKGFIVPEDESDDYETTGTNEEGSEIGKGEIYFENPTTPEGQGLLPGKSLSMGIDEWEKWLQPGSEEEGVNEVSMKDDPTFVKVVELSRTSDPSDGGAAGIYKALDIDLSRFSKINIWLVGKLLEEKGGNIANVNPSYFPEGAVQVRIKYIDENDNQKEWYHAFFYSNIIYYDNLHYHSVTKNRWFWYVSPNLLELKEKPVKITEIRVYGFGWQFKGQVAEVEILGY